MKAEIENKIMLLVNGVYLAGYCDGGQKTNIRIEVSEQATSSLTSLIIKWLEEKRKTVWILQERQLIDKLITELVEDLND
jgi:hypothetical protein